MERVRNEQHARSCRPDDVLVRDIERFLDVDRGSELRESYDLSASDAATITAAVLRVSASMIALARRRRSAAAPLLRPPPATPHLERREEALLPVRRGALVELRRDDDAPLRVDRRSARSDR